MVRSPMPLEIVANQDSMRTLEEDLRLATHLRGLSRVSHATSHDIRTPLHTAVLYLELLRNSLSKSDEEAPAKRERYVEVIGSEIQRFEQMMEALLAQTRIQDEGTERFDLAATARDVIQFLEPHFRRARVQPRLSLPDAPVMIEGERDSIRHALFHVLVTVVDACPPEKEMEFSVSAKGDQATVTLGCVDSAASLAILDSAQGDPSAQRALGAERGLYVARRVVEQHGGSIKVGSGAKSAPTLEIQLPLAAAEDK